MGPVNPSTDVERIRQLLEGLVQAMITAPQGASVFASSSGQSVTFLVEVKTADLGKLIGRGGRIAQSLRSVFRAVGAESGLNVKLDLVSVDQRSG